MDRRLDKRYLTGAVSAMEKEYGAEKTGAIIEDAWRRYAEIVDENDDEPKKMYMHTRKRIYPAIAAFDAMTGNGISREEAAAFLNRYYEKRAAGVGAKIRGAMRIPGLYKLVPKFFAKMTKSSFGEDCGFRANWIRTEREEMCFDMLACPYQDTAAFVASSAHFLICGLNNSSALSESIIAQIDLTFSFSSAFNS